MSVTKKTRRGTSARARLVAPCAFALFTIAWFFPLQTAHAAEPRRDDLDDPVEDRRAIGHEDGAEHESRVALPCRPTVACTADIVPPGDLEIESGIVTKKLNTGFVLQAPTLIKYSISHEVQVQAGGNTLTAVRSLDRSTYFDNAAFTLKVHIVDQSHRRPALALSAGISAPTFHADGYKRAYNAVFTGYLTKDFGPVHADFNMGVNALDFDTVATGQGFVALALSMGLTDHFGVMAETYGFSDAQPYASQDGGFLFAFTHAPKQWLVFDVGADVSYFTTTRVYSTFFGLTIVPISL